MTTKMTTADVIVRVAAEHARLRIAVRALHRSQMPSFARDHAEEAHATFHSITAAMAEAGVTLDEAATLTALVREALADMDATDDQVRRVVAAIRGAYDDED